MALPETIPSTGKGRASAVWLAALAIVIAAVALRLVLIDQVPPGYSFDESEAGILATQVYQGIQRPIFFAEFLGQEPLYIYASAGMMALLGGNQDILPLHLTSVAFGTATVIVTFLLGRALFGARIGLLTAATLATSFWQVMLGRSAYRSISQPLLEALSLYLLCVAWRRGAVIWYVLAGLAVGGTLYTYLSARAFPGVFVAFGVWYLLTRRRPSRPATLRAAALTLGGCIAAVPLAGYFLTHPEIFSMRMEQVFIFRDAVNHGHPLQLLADSTVKLLAGFTLKGEEFWRYSLPGRPMFVGAMAVAFYIGLGVVIAGVFRRDDRYALVAIAVGAMFLPSLLSWDAGSYTLRSMGLVPAIFLIPALGLDWVWNRLARVGPTGRKLAPVVVSLILLVDGLWTARDYFVVWAPSFGASVEGGADSVAQARFLAANARPDTEDVFAGNSFYLNPTLGQLDGQLFYRLRWFDGHQDVVFSPWSHRPALYVIGFGAMPPRVDDIFPKNLEIGEQLFPAGVDGLPPPALFVAYRFTAAQVADRVEQMSADPRLRPVAGEIGHAIVPIGAWIDGPVRAGDIASATLIWRIQSTLPRSDYQLVAQLVDQSWKQVGTVEGLGLPPDEWRPGDVVWSQFQIPVPSGAPPGLDRVQLALYDTHSGNRLPVYGGQPGIQALVLGSVRVTASTPVAPPAISLGARLGPDVRLIGVDPPRLADPTTLSVTLDWSADQPLNQDYTAFVQLLGPDGRLVAQSDNWPANGNLPTSSWLPGETVRDEHHLTLKPGLSPGSYRLIAGMYLLSTGQRLPVAGGGDFVELEKVTLPVAR